MNDPWKEPATYPNELSDSCLHLGHRGELICNMVNLYISRYKERGQLMHTHTHTHSVQLAFSLTSVKLNQLKCLNLWALGLHLRVQFSPKTFLGSCSFCFSGIAFCYKWSWESNLFQGQLHLQSCDVNKTVWSQQQPSSHMWEALVRGERHWNLIISLWMRR